MAHESRNLTGGRRSKNTYISGVSGIKDASNIRAGRETSRGILKLAPALYTEALALADKLTNLEGLKSVGPEE